MRDEPAGGGWWGVKSVYENGDEIGLRVDRPQSYTVLVADLLDRNEPYSITIARRITITEEWKEVFQC